MVTVRLSRVYDHSPATAGTTFLVERLWPRGVRRETSGIDTWLKEVAPSPELRRWFAHDPDKWEEFRRRYFAELDAHPEAWRPILESGDDVTLVFAARDREHNSATALRDYLLAHAGDGPAEA